MAAQCFSQVQGGGFPLERRRDGKEAVPHLGPRGVGRPEGGPQIPLTQLQIVRVAVPSDGGVDAGAEDEPRVGRFKRASVGRVGVGDPRQGAHGVVDQSLHL